MDKPYILNGNRLTHEEYKKSRYDDLRIRVPKGKKLEVQYHANFFDKSLNAFVNRAIEETMIRDRENASVNPDKQST